MDKEIKRFIIIYRTGKSVKMFIFGPLVKLLVKKKDGGRLGSGSRSLRCRFDLKFRRRKKTKSRIRSRSGPVRRQR